jgi:hypothetical protein
VPVAENDTESITPERLEKATEIIEESRLLGDLRADIRESVAAIDKSMKKKEIATLLEEEKLLKRRFFILLKLL